MSRSCNRLENQAIDCLVRVHERREIDFLIPAGEQDVEGVQLLDQLIIQE